jgi:hypothetical protein
MQLHQAAPQLRRLQLRSSAPAAARQAFQVAAIGAEGMRAGAALHRQLGQELLDRGLHACRTDA